MNQTQRNYIVSRVEQITRVKDNELKQKLVVKTPGVTLTPEQEYDAIKRGEYKLKPKHRAMKKGGRWPNVRDWFEFPCECPPKEDRKAYEKASKKLHAEKQALIDEVMVGDNEQALKLLRAFEKKHGSVE